MSTLEDGVAVMDRQKAASKPASDTKGNKGTDLARLPHKDALVRLANNLEYWHGPNGDGYVTIPGVGNLLIGSKAFRDWLAEKYWTALSDGVSRHDLDEAIMALEGRAKYRGPKHAVFIRVAEHDGAVYLDLGNDDLNVVEITGNGWEITHHAPVKFFRPNGMRALPVPEREGSISELRPFVNVADDEAFNLITGCLVGYLRPNIPYPVLILDGEQGSAKSTTTRILRSLIDPQQAGIRPLPGGVRDLVAAAHGSWILAFDNLSKITGPMSDHLCRLASGSGMAARQLYTDRDEVAEDVQRPIIMNGIGLVAWRPDLADRSIKVTLDRIEGANRRTEKEIMEEFEAVRPRVLGALCEAVSTALRRLPDIDVAELPRMADFAKWVTASEEAFEWEPGSFISAYQANRDQVSREVVQDDPVVQCLRRFLDKRVEFEGSATELLTDLRTHADKLGVDRVIPRAANGLSQSLKRLQLDLRQIGIHVEWDRAPNQRGDRIIRIRMDDPVGEVEVGAEADCESEVVA